MASTEAMPLSGGEPGNAILTVDAPFLRLWKGFLTARVMVGFALVMLQSLGQVVNQVPEPAALVMCVAYLVSTVLMRVLAHHRPPSRHAGAQWLPSIGVDIAVVCALQLMTSGALNYTPLFGLPILMAAVLGTLTLAMGTTAGVTLVLLGLAWLGSRFVLEVILGRSA